MSKKIYVGNLSFKTTDKLLYDHFCKAGSVISTTVAKGMGEGVNAGYGYVVMATDEETNSAIKTLHNSLLDGCKIRVIEAHALDQSREGRYWRRRRR